MIEPGVACRRAKALALLSNRSLSQAPPSYDLHVTYLGFSGPRIPFCAVLCGDTSPLFFRSLF